MVDNRLRMKVTLEHRWRSTGQVTASMTYDGPIKDAIMAIVTWGHRPTLIEVEVYTRLGGYGDR